MKPLKRPLISILLLFSCSFLLAQNFAPLTAKWHFQKFCNDPPWINNCGYFTAEVVRDTMVNGVLAKIIENRDIGVLVPDAQVIIREDSNRVYFFENNQFKLLYDFNLNTGDTLTFSIPYNWYYYDYNCSGNADTSNVAQVVIDSTEQLMISGQSLKALYTSPVFPVDTNFYFSWQFGRIIERIGSAAFFGSGTVLCAAYFKGNFRCYNDSLINYKTVAEDCDFVTGIDRYENDELISIYPNPSEGLITLKLDTKNNLNLVEVFNVLGEKIISESIFSKKSVIDISNQRKGIYFVKVTSGNNVITKKIVLE